MMYEAIKYCDIFGTKFNFYTDEKPKFYTLLGGILSALLIIVCIIVFVFYGLDDFKRNTPIVTSSSILLEEYHKIKFGEEKIWIPWRIIDNNNKHINHENLIYPIFTYYTGARSDVNSEFNIQTKNLNYKLCNETSMVNRPDFYKINIPLEQLYCIDMDDLEIGGAWVSLFINYVTMDFYLCEDGINYNETNSKCTTKQDIINRIGARNSLEIAFYYPVIQFQPTNIKYPIIVSYKQYFYYISKFTNKIDRIYFQEYILKDDLGWIRKKSKNSSYWGFSTINGDSYAKTDKNDFINKGSTSKFYSLNIYLQPGVIYYERRYKKITQIIIEVIPVLIIVFKLFKKTANIIKTSEQNKKFFELMFENLRAKKDKFSEIAKKIIIENRKKSNINNNNNNKSRLSAIYHSTVHRRGHFSSQDFSNLAFLNVSISNKSNKDEGFILSQNNKNSLVSEQKNNYGKKNINESHNVLSLFSKQKINENNENNGDKNLASKEIEGIFRTKTKYEISKLFPYRYYFCATFLKNIDITKFTFLFSKKFTKVYKFVGRIFDISSYLTMLREFQVLKTTLLKVEDIDMIERKQKINVGGKAFLKNMNDCISKGKFEIFSKNISKKYN